MSLPEKDDYNHWKKKLLGRIAKTISRRMRAASTRVANPGAQYLSGRTRTEHDLLGEHQAPPGIGHPLAPLDRRPAPVGEVVEGRHELGRPALQRTGEDLGFPDPVYLKAESVEFCSAMMSQRMVAADPRNLVVCPFTVAVYVMVDEPEQVYVAYRRQQLAGDSGEVVEAVNEMLDGIAREAAE